MPGRGTTANYHHHNDMRKLSDIVKGFVTRRHITTRDVMLFLGFVLIASVFWVLVAFSNIMQQDVEVRVEIVGKPQSVTFIDNVPSVLTVTVRDKGTAFLRQLFNTQPRVKINFETYADKQSHTLVVPDYRLLAEARKSFRREATIMKIEPGSLTVKYTTRAPKKVPVNYFDSLNIKPDRQFVTYGDIKVTPDSVLVYGDGKAFADITEVTILPVNETELNHTLDIKVPLKSVSGLRFVPSRVTIVVPVEPLIKREESVAVQVRNVPEKVNVAVFPSTIMATYLVPQGIYKHATNAKVVAVVDYNSINRSSKRAAVTVGEAPAVYREIQLEVDSVEYYIEE